MLSSQLSDSIDEIIYFYMKSPAAKKDTPKKQASTKKVPFSERVGVLTREDIIDAKIISKYGVKKHYKAASYDLRLNNDYLIPIEGGNAYAKHSLRGEMGKVLEIKKYGSAIVSSFEVLNIPKNVIGRFNLRIKIALRGVFVQMGTQVEPGYSGRLFALVHNISNEDIKIELENEPFFTIEFFFIGEEVKLPRKAKSTYMSISDILKPEVSFIKGSLVNLVDNAEKTAEDAKLIAQKAELSSSKAEKQTSDVMRARYLVYTILFAGLISFVASAVAPMMISYSTELYRPTNIETIKLVEEKIEPIEANAISTSNSTKNSLQKLNLKIKSLNQEIGRLKSEIELLKKLTKQVEESNDMPLKKDNQ